MKFLIIASLLASLAAASPVASDLGPVAAPLSKNDEAARLFDRASVSCAIIHSNNNCWSGPGFGYAVYALVVPGETYTFSCYKNGDCFEDNW
jgi:hypothetical protein